MTRSQLLVSTGIGIVASMSFAATSLAGETITYSYDALGRLVAVQSAGTINNNQAHSICYDPSGNRTQYKSSGTGSIAGCAPTPTPSPTPTPTPTPTPNTPPIAVNDSKSVTCQQYVTHNLTANDSDLDGDLPLTITALSRISGSATATIASASSVEIYSEAIGTTVYQYTVKDTRNATDTAQLTITTTFSATCI